jgi:serine protease Do
VEDRDEGVLIATVDQSGPAARAGVHVGDEVVAINGATVNSSRGLIRAVAAVAPGENARVTVRREGQTMEFPVVVGLRPATKEE